MNNIITPVEDPVGFQLDWRHRVASTAERMLPSMGRDPDLKACFQHLQRPSPQFDRIAGWRGTSWFPLGLAVTGGGSCQSNMRFTRNLLPYRHHIPVLHMWIIQMWVIQMW
jgi:hypothetical protein